MRPRPIVEGEITMAPITLETAKMFPRWISDHEVSRYLRRYQDIPDEASEEAWYKRVAESNSECVWQIEYLGKVVGISGIHQIDWINRYAITGTIIGEKSVWRKGIGSKTMVMRADFAFNNLNLRALETHVFEENVASAKAMEKCGYVGGSFLIPRFERDGRVWNIAVKVLTIDRFFEVHPEYLPK